VDVDCKVLRSFAKASALDLQDRYAAQKDTYVSLTLQSRDARCFIGTRELPGIAQVNNRVFRAIRELDKFPGVRCDAYAPREHILALSSAWRKGKAAETMLVVKMNILGPSLFSQQVGILLSDMSIWLQDPEWMENGVAYRNPHLVDFEGLSETDIWLQELVLRSGDASRTPVGREWNDALEELAPTQFSTNVYSSGVLSTYLAPHVELFR
jgi:hypothetical protein